MMRYCGYWFAAHLILVNGIFAASNISRTTENQNIPSRSICGFQEIDTATVGDEVGLAESPWTALLQYTLSSGKIRFLCSGSLISPRYVLTAAHCANPHSGKLTGVRFGEYSTKTEIDCLTPNNCNERPVDIEVEEIIFHENYSITDRNHYNDIALLRLKKDVPYSRFIRPICLPESNESSTTGDLLTLTKWEREGEKSEVIIKRKVKLPVVSTEQCESKYSKMITFADSQFCAGGQHKRDACQGDGGGPLLKETRADHTQWYQEGIVSFGANPCGLEGYPSVYTKVVNYLSWIYSKVRD
ncbi:phenoloxidase-activating factor 3 [Leptinotarsa decemlineata]|uniref:phenoloxidase-activating factor 3 n=1 Tax=Leptinotarsa decemlineata TaxID=7539 RepID=UPI003D3041F8